MKLIFLNRFFHPDHSATSQMLSDIAFGLSERSWDVTVITSRQRYDAPLERLPANETIRGVSVHRIWTTHFGRRNLVGRAIDYLTFYCSAAWMLVRCCSGGDLIIAKTDPPMLSVIASPIAKLRGALLVNWLQDIFPEVAEVIGMGRGRLSSRLVFDLLRKRRDISLTSARMNVVIGERMKERLLSFGIAPSALHTIPNFADGALLKPIPHDQNPLRRAWGLENKFVVAYSGNLGRAHEYDTLIDAIAALEKTPTAETITESAKTASPAPQIVWLFIGGGALFETFKANILNRGLKSVHFEPYQPRERLAESLSTGDVHLVSLRTELEGLIVPSKFYGIAAVGRPTIFIGARDGEIADMLNRHECGLTVRESDGQGLAAAILSLAADESLRERMGSNARAAFEQEYDRPIVTERWHQLLQKITTGSG